MQMELVDFEGIEYAVVNISNKLRLRGYDPHNVTLDEFRMIINKQGEQRLDWAFTGKYFPRFTFLASACDYYHNRYTTRQRKTTQFSDSFYEDLDRWGPTFAETRLFLAQQNLVDVVRVFEAMKQHRVDNYVRNGVAPTAALKALKESKQNAHKKD